MSELYFGKDIEEILERIDYKKLGNNVAIKLHFGEKGCTTYIEPSLVKAVYDKIVSLGKKASLVECNVLYVGSRTNSTDHLRTAREHGFDFAPIDILDGELGDEFIEVKLDSGTVNPVKLGKGIEKYDSMVVLTHFKGHGSAGYGGIFKNVGMGLGSKAGKLHMHSNMKVEINKDKCVGCGICAKNCNFGAITVNGTARVYPDKCVGCAMCISVCPYDAVQTPLGDTSSEDLQKRIVDYTGGVFKIVPKEKMIFINILKDITKKCDCKPFEQKPMMEDIGVLMGYDPVAVDKASLDLADKKSNGQFSKVNGVDTTVQTDYAAEKGMGVKEYSLVAL